MKNYEITDDGQLKEADDEEKSFEAEELTFDE